jgi:acyl transferase domain-containing protein
MSDGHKIVVLFPGQGAYDPDALVAAIGRHPQVTQVFDELDAVSEELFSQRLTSILLREPRPTIRQLLAEASWVSQLAIYGCDMAAYRILADHGLRPDVLVGHSLGEIAALVAANAFSLADGARIVIERVRVIEELGVTNGRMVALSEPAERVQRIIALIDDPLLAIAIENHDAQTVVSGTRASLDRVLGIAGHLQAGVIELNAPFAFHTPILEPATSVFADRIRPLTQRPPDLPVYSPILGRYYEPDDSLADLLAQHFTRPVRFSAAVRQLHADGAHRFIESGAMSVLSKLVFKALGKDSAVTAWPSLAMAKTGGLALDDTLARLRGEGLVSGDPAGQLGAMLAPAASPGLFREFWSARGASIIRYVQAQLDEFTPTGATTATVPFASPPRAPTTTAAVVDRDALAAQVRAIYSTALEYPEEVFTDDVLLEAELGVDSVKQIELLTRVSQHYDLPPREGSFRLANHDTMGKIVTSIHAQLRAATNEVVPVTG